MGKHRRFDKWDLLMVAVVGVSIYYTYLGYVHMNDAKWETIRSIAESVLTGAVFAIVGRYIYDRALKS